MDNADERWLSRRELAERYGLPVKTLAQWASKGTGPHYARMGRHVRYRLSDVSTGKQSGSTRTHTTTPTLAH